MARLSDEINIGKVVEQQLHEVGISSINELRQTGSREAWLRILAMDPSACYNRLCGLEGAIRGIRWHNLDEDVKRELKTFYMEHKG